MEILLLIIGAFIALIAALVTLQLLGTALVALLVGFMKLIEICHSVFKKKS